VKDLNTFTPLFQPSAEGGTPRHLVPVLRAPNKRDAAAIHTLVSQCPPLDLNSLYTYLLLSEHFRDTCVVAEDSDGIEAFVSAYVPPGRADVLFVWQVAVHERARSKGLARHMLTDLLRRPELGGIKYIETTVDPDNHASRSLFASMARQLGADSFETSLFEGHLFGMQQHPDEPLIRIGPFRPA